MPTAAPVRVPRPNVPDYPIVRMNEAPRVTTRVLPTANHPGGIGAVGRPPPAPAMANAIAALTGMRRLPGYHAGGRIGRSPLKEL